MAKSKKQFLENKVSHAGLLAGLSALAAWNLIGSQNSGRSDLINIAYRIGGTLILLFALIIFVNRKQLTSTQILRLIGIHIAAFAVVFGWKLCSYTDSPFNVQNDGYNVTGGFMMLFGGFYYGYIYAKDKLSNDKK